MADLERAVVFRLSALGDVVLTTGVLARWNRLWGTRFTFITRSASAPVLQHHPAIDEVVVMDEDRQRGSRWWAQAGELAARFQGTPLIDLHGTLRARVLSRRWQGVVHRYPKHGLARRLFNLTGSKGLAHRLEATCVTQRYALALEQEPPPPGELLPRLFPTPEELERGRALLPAPEPGPVIALHPYATHPNKAWPREHWRSLAGLLDRTGLGWVVIGRNGMPLFPDDPRDLTNATDLRATMALLAGCSALATNDSGPMHLAAGVGTPVAALFGPTCRAWGFYPQGPRDRVLERTDLDCRPCSLHGRKPCPRNRSCLAAIAPREVLEALQGILNP